MSVSGTKGPVKGISLNKFATASRERLLHDLAGGNVNGNRYLTRAEARQMPAWLRKAYDGFVALPEHKGKSVTVEQFAKHFDSLLTEVRAADTNKDEILSQLERNSLPEGLRALYTVLVRQYGQALPDAFAPKVPPLPQDLPRVDNWFTKSPEDGVEGASVDKAYLELNLPKLPSPKPVIVAVIDSGMDITHEDLRGPLDANGNPTDPSQDRIWTNSDEVAGDQIDNDKNGYVDDVHGWNFLGSMKNGKPVSLYDTTIEATREKRRLEAIKAQRPLTAEEAATLAKADKIWKEARASGLPANYTDLKADTRKAIIGDDPEDYSDRNYGNPDVNPVNSGEKHSTHVAGIIAAIRDNMKGTMGVASDVKLMPVRAIPNGDEYDKDIANAVRYAVDNGATVINMSFGKPLSPGRTAVLEAFQYAASKDVLIIHAAGNDGLNLDDPNNPHFPDRDIPGKDGTQVPGWIEVGASGPTLDARLPASFSNYGKTEVDLFAPGVKIPSPVPYGNRYANLSGTSMATPVVAGVAAVLRSVFPLLTADDIKDVIEASVRPHPDLPVSRPGTGDKVKFGELSRTGGLVDLYAAVKSAMTLSEQREAEANRA